MLTPGLCCKENVATQSMQHGTYFRQMAGYRLKQFRIILSTAINHANFLFSRLLHDCFDHFISQSDRLRESLGEELLDSLEAIAI